MKNDFLSLAQIQIQDISTKANHASFGILDNNLYAFYQGENGTILAKVFEIKSEYEKFCSAQGGNICSSSQTCSGSWLSASDSDMCCVGTCQNVQQVSYDSPFGAHGYYNIISDIADVGIKYKRNTAQEGLVWDLVEPNLDGNYEWANFESNLDTAESLGLTVMVTIKSYNNNDQTCNADRYCIRRGRCRFNPCDWDKYKIFINTAIEKYGDRIKYWQIENEPKESGGYFSETPEGYGKLLSTSYGIIKNKCSDCNVLLAGIWNNEGFTYYNDLFNYLKNNNLKNSFDIFDMHTATNHNTVGEVYGQIDTLLSQYEYSNIPIWSTEFGPLASDPSNCVVPDDIGSTLIKNYVAALDIGFEKLFWRVSECPSFIINKENKKIDTYYAYKTLISKLEGFSSISKFNEWQYKFNVDGNDIYVLWCDSGNCVLPSGITGSVKVTDYFGSEEIKDSTQVILTESPVFIEEK